MFLPLFFPDSRVELGVFEGLCRQQQFRDATLNDLWLLDLKFVPLLTLVQCNVSTKLKIPTAFLFREGTERTDGRRDWVQHLMRPLVKMLATFLSSWSRRWPNMIAHHWEKEFSRWSRKSKNVCGPENSRRRINLGILYQSAIPADTFNFDRNMVSHLTLWRPWT